MSQLDKELLISQMPQRDLDTEEVVVTKRQKRFDKLNLSVVMNLFCVFLNSL